MHNGRTLEAYDVWRRIRGVNDFDSKAEFFVMKASVADTAKEMAAKRTTRRFVWLDFFTYVSYIS